MSKSIVTTEPRALAKVERVLYDIPLPAAGCAYVRACGQHVSPDTVAGPRDPKVRFCSQILGLQTNLELWGSWPMAHLLEADARTVHFFGRPHPVTLDVKAEDGRTMTTSPYCPTLLVVRHTEVVAIDLRTLRMIAERAARDPYQFYQDADGWHYRAAEEWFCRLGIKHELRDKGDVAPVLARNVSFLQDYLRQDCPALDQDVAARLRGVLEEGRCVPFRDLIGEGAFSSDDVYKALAEGLVYVDLAVDLLEETATLHIYSDRATQTVYREKELEAMSEPLAVPGMTLLRTGCRVQWQGETYLVEICTDSQVMMRAPSGASKTMDLTAMLSLHKSGHVSIEAFRSDSDRRQIADLSNDALERALTRRKAIDCPEAYRFKPETVAEFKRRIVGCNNNFLTEVAALADGRERQGNHTPRRSEQNRKLGTQAITRVFNQPENASAKAAHTLYSELCEQNRNELGQPLNPVSYAAFCVWVNQDRSECARRGSRWAYQKKAIVVNLESTFPHHGRLPHEICYIDHTVATIATRSHRGDQLRKPTLTVGLDGHSKNSRAMLLVYEPPSAKLVLQLLRAYWHRWKRWPKYISVDGGKEFRSRELVAFCDKCNIGIIYRPIAQPRFGSPIERLLGATEEEVLGQLEGNTRLMREARMVTQSVNPFIRARHTLSSAYERIEKYLFQVRPNRIHPELDGLTPNEFEALRLKETGEREHVLPRGDAAENEDVNLLTAPHPRVWMHKVDSRRGVWVDNMWYFHPAMRHIRKGTKVEVRVEPWLHRVIYVHIGKWLAAFSSNYEWCGNRTRREVEMALRFEKRQGPVLAKRDSFSLAHRRAMSELCRPAPKFDLTIALEQEEMRRLYAPLSMTLSIPVEGLANEEVVHEVVTPVLATELAAEGDPAHTPAAQNGQRPAQVDDLAGTHGIQAQNPIDVRATSQPDDDEGELDEVPGYS